MDRDLEEDMSRTEWFLNKIKANDSYAQNIYSALCNMRWQPQDIMPILKDEYWSCSWRSAGGIVADLRKVGEDYIDWYCSGMSNNPGSVPEGTVTDEVREDLFRLGWVPSPWPKDGK